MSGVELGQRAVQLGAGYCRSSPLKVHFGLGAKPAARYPVEVLFSGKNRVVTDDVAAGQRLVVKEP